MKLYLKLLFCLMGLNGCYSNAMQEIGSAKTFKEFFGIDDALIRGSSEVGYTPEEKVYWLAHQLQNTHEWFDSVQQEMHCYGGVIKIEHPKLWIKTHARNRIITRMLIEKIIKIYNFKQVKLPKEYVFFTYRNSNEILTAQSVDDISHDLDCHIVQEHIEYSCEAKMNGVQAQELTTLLRFVYLDLGRAENIYIQSDAAYIIDTEDKGEHFITNWPKLWSRFNLDNEAKLILEQKRRELQKYSAHCLRRYKQEHNGELPNTYFTSLPLIFENEPFRHYVCPAFYGSILTNLFGSKEEEEQFWQLVYENGN